MRYLDLTFQNLFSLVYSYAQNLETQGASLREEVHRVEKKNEYLIKSSR